MCFVWFAAAVSDSHCAGCSETGAREVGMEYGTGGNVSAWGLLCRQSLGVWC